MRRCDGALYGPLIFMGVTGNAIYQDAFYKIKRADEKQWINNVIGRKGALSIAAEKQIECPKEYTAYYESTLERRRKRLEKQLVFLQPRYSGLHDSIIFVTSAGLDPQPGLEKAHRDYLLATAETEAKLNGLCYLMKDFQITADIAEAESKLTTEGVQNAESSDT